MLAGFFNCAKIPFWDSQFGEGRSEIVIKSLCRCIFSTDYYWLSELLLDDGRKS